MSPKFEALRLSAASEGIYVAEKRVWQWKLVYIVSFMWLWNRDFLKSFTTTFRNTIYVIDEANFGTKRHHYFTLRHEIVHIRDSRRLGQPVWFALYGFPQILALGAFGAFWNLWCLLFLVALGPWPAPGRVWAEMRGYDETFLAYSDVGDPIDVVRATNWMAGVFCGWGYWRMSWSEARIRTHYSSLITTLNKRSS